MITFAPLTDVDAPKIPRRTTRLEHDRVLAKIVDSAFAFESAMGDTAPENWPWRPFDPKLADLFRFVNDRYFQGRIPPHDVFWFDAAGFDDHDDVGIMSCLSTMGFRSDFPPHGRVIGLALRLKVAPAEALQVMRHECCHALVGAEHQHDAVFRQALVAQAEPGDTWVRDEVRRYELLDGGIQSRVTAFLEGLPGNVPWPGAITRMRQFLRSEGLTVEDLNQVVDCFNPYVRALMLRAVEFAGPGSSTSPRPTPFNFVNDTRR